MELLDPNIVSTHKKINFKKQLLKFLKYWYWVVASMLLFYGAAYFYLKYKQPKYQSKTTILFQESKSDKGALADLKSLGMGVSDNDELQGEAAIIVSKPILSKVVENLSLNVSFYAKGKIREIELYDKAPYKGKVLFAKEGFSGVSYYIQPVNKNTFKLSEGPLNKGQDTFRYGEVINLPWGKIQIDRNPKGYNPYKNYVVFRSTKSVVNQLENDIKVQIPSGLLMDLTIMGYVPKKSEDILNELTKQYNVDVLNDKNAEAQNTQNFIDSRLDLISNDLDKIETNKENFKKSNQITELETQANLAVNRLSNNVSNYFDASIKLELLNSLYAMATSGKEQLFPTGLGLSPTTETLLSQYNETLLTKKRTLKQATTANPSIKAFDRELADQLAAIRSNLQYARNQIQQKLGQTNQEIGQDKGTIYKYPTQEKTFRNIERQRNLKESLYLYLLQKREENAITLAVNTAKTKVVNPAYTSGVVEPKYKQVRTTALIMGFLLPLIIIFVRDTLDTKIRDKADLEAMSSAHVIAEIPVYDGGDNPKVEVNDFTLFAESFRMLVSNIKFILRSKNIKKGATLLITSSVKGEGKTTVSYNTALSLAGSGKVLLMGADIRNPQLHRYFDDLKRTYIGLTDYLVSNQNVDDFIQATKVSPNLFILPGGSTAPNPNDLLDMEKFDQMVMELREKFDYIIMDSAPVMLVSDSLHLLDACDLVIYTVKSEYTNSDMVNFANNFKNNNNISNMVFVLNNVKPNYIQYSYKYGYGYYETVKKKSFFFSKIFNS